MTDIVERLRKNAAVLKPAKYVDDLLHDICEAADEIERLREALREAENALADYVPTLAAKGSVMAYGEYVLAKARSALEEKE